MTEKLENNIIRNEADYPKIFGLTESEVLEIMEAVREYSIIKDSQSYKDWVYMYNGIHRESTFESAVKNWLACVRWMKSKSVSPPPDSTTEDMKVKCENCEQTITPVRLGGFCPECFQDI